MSLDSPLRIAYAIQNVGLRLNQETGDMVPVKYSWRGLRQAGHQVSLFMLDRRRVLQFQDTSRLDQVRPAAVGITGSTGFRILESGVRRLQGHLHLPYFALLDSYRFYEACVRSLPNYDLCHEHNGLFSTGAALACSRKRLPYILTFSADPLMELALVGKPLHGLHAAAAARAARFTFRIARRILCVSEPAKRHLVETWDVEPDRICVMPNGVDVDLFGRSGDEAAIRARLGLLGSQIVMFVGGFEPWHGIDLLVQSFARLRAASPAARLVLVGDGPARPEIARQVATLGLEPFVVFTGLIPHASVPEILSIADVVTIPYPRLPQELWFSPLKLYEYMAAGRAIVAANAGQIAETIHHGYDGLLVEPGSEGELAQRILELLQNPDLRAELGRNAREGAVRRHSWQRYIERLEEIYRDALRTNGRQN